eukprot:TRINITY_DN13162_c0_g1_i1.p1 TRINITY_DN13162_c0_g1~~TRINITY_DN13162_c0_g1_i1.p1  ORF type:complete len:531 (-),score=78.60 TRINITY_DN13162_c0_g1_i1:318-1910(-)
MNEECTSDPTASLSAHDSEDEDYSLETGLLLNEKKSDRNKGSTKSNLNFETKNVAGAFSQEMLEIRGNIHKLRNQVTATFDDVLDFTQDTDILWEGMLYKRKRRWQSEWKKTWCVLRIDDYGRLFLHYYHADDAGKDFVYSKNSGILAGDGDGAKGSIEIRFLLRTKFLRKQQEAVALYLERRDRELSNEYLILFAPGRMYYVCANTATELDTIQHHITTFLKKNMSTEEFSFREDCAEELQSWLAKKYFSELEQGHTLLKVLEENGLLRTSHSNPAKRGQLDLLSERGRWKTYSFTLKGKYLYYYPSGHHEQQQVIVLRYSDIHLLSDKASESPAQPAKRKRSQKRKHSKSDIKRSIEIVTPMTTYQLRAPHESAAREWVKMMEASLMKRTRSSTAERIKKGLGLDTVKVTTQSTEVEEIDKITGIDPMSCKCYVTYVPYGRKRSKKKILKHGTTKIGRGGTNQISLKTDNKVSREHARFDTVAGKLVFVDMGSKRGSKVNHHVVRKPHIVQEGDVIKIGNTTMVVHVS